MAADQFPSISSGIYANHAAISPWPRAAAEAVAAFASENTENGPTAYRNWIERERELRGLVARLINAPSRDDIALLANTTQGVSIIAFGFPWKDGDNVVIPAGEFPSNRLPWLAQERRGVDVREIDVRVDRPEDALLGAIDDRTQILAVSSIQYSDGLRLDIHRLGEACRKAGILFFVDAIQHLGAFPLDVQSAQVDCLAAGAHKWMLGPEGIGIFYCSPKARASLALSQAGWHMFDYPWNFDRADWTPSSKARRFEAGSPNTLGQVALHASLTLLMNAGMDEVAARISANSHRLIAGIESMPDVRLRSSGQSSRQSGIVSFEAVDSPTREVFKRLMQAGVSCAYRGGCVRLSPHFYQDHNVIDRILNHVEDAV